VAKHTGHLHLLLQLPCENTSSQYDDALSPLSPDMLHEVKTKRLAGNAYTFLLILRRADTTVSYGSPLT